MRAHPDGGNNGRCLNKFSGHANAWARGHQGSSTFNADGSRSVRRSPALDQFSWRRAKPRFMTPNAGAHLPPEAALGKDKAQCLAACFLILPVENRVRLSPHPAQHLGSFSTNIVEHLFPFRW